MGATWEFCASQVTAASARGRAWLGVSSVQDTAVAHGGETRGLEQWKGSARHAGPRRLSLRPHPLPLDGSELRTGLMTILLNRILGCSIELGPWCRGNEHGQRGQGCSMLGRRAGEKSPEPRGPLRVAGGQLLEELCQDDSVVGAGEDCGQNRMRPHVPMLEHMCTCARLHSVLSLSALSCSSQVSCLLSVLNSL